MKIKKVLSFVPAFMLACSTTFATGYCAPVLTLPNGEQACPPPCATIKDEISLSDGSKACALHVPQNIETEVFVIMLSDAGRDMVQAMRPSDIPDGQFSVRANSALSMEQAEKFGVVVNRLHFNVVRNPKSPQPFGGMFEASDIVPLSVKSGDDDIPFGNIKAGLIVKIDVLESLCKSARVKANVVISNIEAFSPAGYEFTLPRVSLLTANQVQNVQFGGGFFIGGFQNVGEVMNNDEFAVFVNVYEGAPIPENSFPDTK